MGKSLLVATILLIFSGSLMAQISNEFWFVAPEIASSHGDTPIYMRISTMNDTATVMLRMPANPAFLPITQKINPNTTFSINLTPWLNDIENRPANQVLNKGLYLTSDQAVSAYYECANISNPGIFGMKGLNALGTDFYIVSQNNYQNHDGQESFDIVASEDNTTVTITPSDTIVGHSPAVGFTVILMKGQTYSARAVYTNAPRTLAGSHITSDKPVAVTWQDDSIMTGGWDIVCDQTIPVNLLGKEYIAIKGFADNNPPSNNDERVYILATQDSTIVRIDGTNLDTINTAQQYNYGIPAGTNTALVQTSKPCYALHLSGHPGEAGASILPQDSCTGSASIGFARTNNNQFALLILTRNGNQDSFYLNGSNAIITAANFNPVPNTSGNWVYYRQNNLSTLQVPVGANLIENTKGTFHLGIIHMTGASSEYGYFSNFASLYLGADASICPGDSMVLDGGAYMTSYEWKRGSGGTWVTVDTNRFYTVHDTGYYACMTNGDFCTLMDTIRVDYYPNATVSLGPDRTICQGTTTTFDPGVYVTYEWSTGLKSRYLTTGTGGTYWVKVINNNGCVAFDTVVLYIDSLPMVNHGILGPDTVCQGQNNILYTIDSLHFAQTYIWTLPPGASGTSDTSFIMLSFSLSATPGLLKVRGHNLCGDGPDTSLYITVKPLPGTAGSITGTNVVCQGVSGIAYTVPAVTNAAWYAWTLPPGATMATGAGTNSITVNFGLGASSGNISVQGQNDCGTGSTSVLPVSVNLFPQPAGPLAGPDTVCQGQTGIAYSVAPITGADSYLWTLPAGATITSGAGTNLITVAFDSTSLSGNITVRGHSNNCGDGIPSLLPLTVNPLPAPAGPVTGPFIVCQGQTGVIYSVGPIANATSYNWTTPPGSVIVAGGGTNQITVDYGTSAASGIFTVRGHNNTCGDGRRSGVNVTVNPLPASAGSITGAAAVCQLQNGVPYSIPAIPFATSYVWNYSGTGAAIINNGASSLISYSFTATPGNLTVTGHNGCGDGPVSPILSVVVNPAPRMSLQICNNIVTRDAKPFILRGGIPLNGNWSGDGVTVNVFNPANVPMVTDSAKVTYTYINMYGCSNQAVQKIKVFPVQPFTCGGTLSDVRDNKGYPTVMIGTQCWMAANLDFGTGIPSSALQMDNCVAEKYCYGDLAASCISDGGLYSWDELMQYQSVAGTQGLCPPRWHVPTESEWSTLFNFYINNGFAASPLKYSGYSGFNALLQGARVHNRSYIFSGFATLLWSSNVAGPYKSWAHGMNDYDPSVSYYPAHRSNNFGVRCIRD